MTFPLRSRISVTTCAPSKPPLMRIVGSRSRRETPDADVGGTLPQAKDRIADWWGVK